MSSILIANRLCQNANGTFALARVQESVLKLLKISQLDAILKIFSTIEEAQDYVMMEELEREIKSKP